MSRSGTYDMEHGFIPEDDCEMRLTDKRGWVTPLDSDTIAKIYKKLAAYEDAEEQGFLVTLPRDTRERIDVLEDLLRLSKMCLARKTRKRGGS